MGKGKLATILRCTGLALIVVGAFVLLPAVAQAGVCDPTQHGVSIFKSCTSPKNRCATDADCSDSDQCNGIEQCATEENPGSNVVSCIITLSNPAIHCDNITILDAADTILNATGPGATSSTIQIIGVSTNVISGTCTAGTDLGGATTCTIGPGGSVTFLANYYTTVPTDPSTLNDQASISVQDTCSSGAAGCSTTPNNVQFTASTTTVSGCSPGTPLNCDDSLFCTDDSCDPATGCVHVPHPCADTDLCTTDTCNEDTNGCQFTPVVCPDDDNLCNGTPACNPATGACDPGTSVVCDDPVCTACNPATGSCDLPADPLPPECTPSTEICRTPGFWGTHGGTEKNGSQDITGLVLAAFGGTLDICGVTIDTSDEALQAICVSPKGDQRLQLARQLTSAALNCAITAATPESCSIADGENPCANVSIHDIFEACNDVCEANTGVTATLNGDTFSCIAAIDCFNNGGVFDTATGDCNCPGGFDENGECLNSCHSQPLSTDCFEFVPPGPAGSSHECQTDRKDCTTIFGSQCP
jgi:hypothetical protein